MLNIPSTSHGSNTILDTSLIKKYNLDITEYITDHDYDVLPTFIDITNNAENVITYISGFVIKMLKKRIACPKCICSTLLASQDTSYQLIHRKNRGKITFFIFLKY